MECAFYKFGDKLWIVEKGTPILVENGFANFINV